MIGVPKVIDKEAALTASELRSRISYDPVTGGFSRTRGKKPGCVSNDGRLIIGVDGYQYLAHRLAWLYMTGEWPSDTIDHIDRNPLNNVWSNLRMATRSEQAMNRSAQKSKGGTSAVGVYWRKDRSKWIASIKLNGGKQIHLGYFHLESDAIAAYEAAKAEHHHIDTYEKAA